MKRVFVSYSGCSAVLAQSVHALLKSIGAEVNHYKDPDLNNTMGSAGSAYMVIDKQIRECELFIAIFEDLGQPLQLPDGSSEPALMVEHNLFWKHRNIRTIPKRYIGLRLPVPHGKDASEVNQFIEGLGAQANNIAQVGDYYNAFRAVVSAYYGDVSPPSGFLRGFLDEESECTDIVEKVIEHIRSDIPFPQRYLYASLHGAQMWEHLARDVRNPLGAVFSKFPLRQASHPFQDWLYNKLAEKIPDRPWGRTIGVLVLGCGDGCREAQICRWLLDVGIAEAIKVMLVDVSSELIARASRAFSEALREGCEIRFAVLNFERMDRLAQLRRYWAYDMPVLVLFLGNTLGNLPEARVVGDISASLNNGDMMLAEVLAHETTNDVNALRAKYRPEEDPRFEFITHPLLISKLSPRPSGLTRPVDPLQDGNVIIQRFLYKFSEKDACKLSDPCSDRAIDIAAGDVIELLQIRSIHPDYLRTLLQGRMLQGDVYVHEYDLWPSRSVKMAYGLGIKG